MSIRVVVRLLLAVAASLALAVAGAGYPRVEALAVFFLALRLLAVAGPGVLVAGTRFFSSAGVGDLVVVLRKVGAVAAATLLGARAS